MSYYLNVVDIKHQYLSTKFKIPNHSSKEIGLYTLIKVKKMLVKLSTGNCAIHDGLVNGTDGFLKIFILINLRTCTFI